MTFLSFIFYQFIFISISLSAFSATAHSVNIMNATNKLCDSQGLNCKNNPHSTEFYGIVGFGPTNEPLREYVKVGETQALISHA